MNSVQAEVIHSRCYVTLVILCVYSVNENVFNSNEILTFFQFYSQISNILNNNIYVYSCIFIQFRIYNICVRMYPLQGDSREKVSYIVHYNELVTNLLYGLMSYCIDGNYDPVSYALLHNHPILTFAMLPMNLHLISIFTKSNPYL